MRFDSLCRWMPITSRMILLVVALAHLLGNTAMPLTLPSGGHRAGRQMVEAGCCCAAAGKACQCGSGCCGTQIAAADEEAVYGPGDEPGKVVWIMAPLRSPCNGLGAGSILQVPAVLTNPSTTVYVFFPENSGVNTQFRQLPGIERDKPASPPPKA